MSLKGNKGEWSEIYTLLKVLADKNIYGGDSELNKVEDLIFPVIKVLRDESNGTYEFSYDKDLVVIKRNKEEFRISISEFQKQAVKMLRYIKEANTTTFSIPEIENFIKSFNCKSIKAKSTVKSDINIVIHDNRTSSTSELGFSIKSQLGGASTLLNAGRTTNFIYEIIGSNLSADNVFEINSINSRSKIKDRIERIQSLSNRFVFLRTENITFGNNLTLIDSSLPQIISELLLQFFTTSTSKTSELVEKVAEINPLAFNRETNHPFYSYKIKRFLTDIALGMMPSKVWTGKLDATGGYLVVKDDGEILCYHIYNRNEFEDYLLRNTKLETASSSRHNFGSVFEENGKHLFKLNLQIRFIK